MSVKERQLVSKVSKFQSSHAIYPREKRACDGALFRPLELTIERKLRQKRGKKRSMVNRFRSTRNAGRDLGEGCVEERLNVPSASGLGRSASRTLGHGSGGGAEGSSGRDGEAGGLCDGSSEHGEEKYNWRWGGVDRVVS